MMVKKTKNICDYVMIYELFSYIWRTRFVDQDISAGLQYFIIMLLGLIFYLYQNICSLCDLDVALIGHEM